MAASRTTLRGQSAQYLYTRDGEAITSQDYVMNSASDDQDLTGGEFDGVATALGDAALAAMVAGINSVDDTDKKELTYNPITDQYGVRPNNYSVFRS